jgi:hypothetical protein
VNALPFKLCLAGTASSEMVTVLGKLLKLDHELLLDLRLCQTRKVPW